MDDKELMQCNECGHEWIDDDFGTCPKCDSENIQEVYDN